MSIFLTGRRSATTTLAQIHAYDLNLCTDLHCSRRTLTLAAPRSCAATSSTNALMGVCCHQPVRLPRANPHSARGTTACHFPRFRSLKFPSDFARPAVHETFATLRRRRHGGPQDLRHVRQVRQQAQSAVDVAPKLRRAVLWKRAHDRGKEQPEFGCEELRGKELLD